ncbi:MAG: hypothetical protein FRX48_06361 [Lasallia pustulata]|uniref:Uncharacterized protein n=1 Tax=Lasallia pustulata TaxID=136370 RepID=A0A5M8PJX3_9LECA|nr:MAG: hypothetical protein FRX48_06361 [Lasallia pustulata]
MTEQISTQRCDLFTATSNTATSSGPITSEMQIRGRIGPGLGSPRPPISVSSGEGKDGEEELDDDAKENSLL